MEKDCFAIEIKKDSSYDLAVAIWPHLAELNRDEIQGHFVVFGTDEKKKNVMALCSPVVVGDNWDHIENFDQLMIKKLVA
jgi:hypothetical protein